MLSRVAFRSGSLVPRAWCATQIRVSPVAVRVYSSEKSHDAPKLPSDPQLSVSEIVQNWDNANKLYYGPERDLKNFPHPVCPLTNPPVRLGFLPDSWFKFFEEKTGVTGPYVFGAGLLTYLLSKEIWIVEHGFSHFVSFWIVFYIIVRKFGKSIAKFADDVGEAQLERHWHKPMKKVMQQSEEVIKENEKLIWCEEGQKYLFEAKRENVDLQLEAAFRQRQVEVYEAVKKRLDYQMEVDNARRRIEQQHMVQWIVDQVVKGITPQQEKDSLVKCIQDLKALASQKPAVA